MIDVTKGNSNISKLFEPNIMLKPVSLVLLLISSVSVGGELPPKETFGIFGPNGILHGSVTNITKHPYQAAIYDDSGFIGSGAIVDRKWVLTSARPPSDVEKGGVKVGTTNITEANTLIGIEKVLFHPKFNLGTNYNLALLKLKTPLSFSDNVKTISVASKSPRSRTEVVTTGWGIDQDNSSFPSSVLRKAELLIVTREDCFRTYPASIVSDSSICAYKDDVELSYFDAGNPLVENDKLVGIFVGNLQNFYCKKHPCPFIFTDLTLMKHWVENTIQKH